jgi:hypothetical protein
LRSINLCFDFLALLHQVLALVLALAFLFAGRNVFIVLIKLHLQCFHSVVGLPPLLVQLDDLIHECFVLESVFL